MAKMFFFFLFFRRAISNLRDFYNGFCTKQQHFPLSRRIEPLTEELWLPLLHHFFFTCKHAHKSLSNEIYILSKIAELEIQLVFEESLVWSMILQPIPHTSTEEGLRTDLLLCDRWQTSAQACICC